MIKPFLNDHFLLQNSTAEKLYHDYAKDLPIIDYHNHLPPDEIANDKTFSSITEVWLKGDHYKWRAMRANGIYEKFITGESSDRDKFLKWAETVPYTMRNPLYHWTHLELQRYFDIDKLLDSNSSNEIYDQTNAALKSQDFSVKGLLRKMNVEVVCTTDHPTDSLEFHKKEMDSDSAFKMLPTFRPDKFVVIDNPEFLIYLEKLEGIIGNDISTYDGLLSALEDRVDFFHSLGCQLADHGLSQLYDVDFSYNKLDQILQKRKASSVLHPDEVQSFQVAILYDLSKMYHRKNWTMQFHLGAIRNNNTRLLELVGADVGADSIGDFNQAEGLSAFLNNLDIEDRLAKTILYNLNPRDNELFATMMGNFNDGSLAGKVQWGSAWWFLDQKDGMEKQINTLSNMGLLSRFIGMLTDSRSFLSFPRHEYFRRILCNLIGQDIHDGLLPNDIDWLGKMVQDICYYNAKTYFNFQTDVNV
ncbi:glucuronate isomerase [Saprospiraceae bacterium]|nr:glucuronate isomerase [Saprospiraceae bacterium]